MFTSEMAQPRVVPNLKIRWRLRLLHRLFVVLEAIATPPKLIRHVSPGLLPEHEHEFRPTPQSYR